MSSSVLPPPRLVEERRLVPRAAVESREVQNLWTQFLTPVAKVHDHRSVLKHLSHDHSW